MNKVKLLRLPSSWIPSNEGNITHPSSKIFQFFFFSYRIIIKIFSYRIDTRKDFTINTNVWYIARYN